MSFVARALREMRGRDSPGHLAAPVVSMAIWTRWITCSVVFRWGDNPLLGPWWEYEEIDWPNGKTRYGSRNDYNGRQDQARGDWGAGVPEHIVTANKRIGFVPGHRQVEQVVLPAGTQRSVGIDGGCRQRPCAPSDRPPRYNNNKRGPPNLDLRNPSFRA